MGSPCPQTEEDVVTGRAGVKTHAIIIGSSLLCIEALIYIADKVLAATVVVEIYANYVIHYHGA